jgi:hypothetical protein
VDSCPCLIHTTISHPIFFSRIQHFYKSKPNSEYHIFDSSFLYNLHYGGYNDVKKYTSKVDVFQKHVLLMPMCTNLHWILYVVVNPHQCGKVLDNDTNGPVILCLDSLGNGCSGVESSIRDFLEKEWTKSRNHAHLAFPFSKKNIPLLIPKGSLLVFPVFFGMHYHQSKYLTNSLPIDASVKKQENGYDCGVFVCQYMLAIVRLFLDFPEEIRLQKKDGWVNFVEQHEYFNFSQRHMNIKRRIIFQTILGFFSKIPTKDKVEQFLDHIQKKYAQGADNVTTSDTDVLCETYRTLHLTRKQLCTPTTSPRIRTVYKEIYGIGVYKLENNKPLPLPEGHSGVNDVYGGWPWKSLQIQDNKKAIDVYLRRCYECPNGCAVTDAKNLLEEDTVTEKDRDFLLDRGRNWVEDGQLNGQSRRVSFCHYTMLKVTGYQMSSLSFENDNNIVEDPIVSSFIGLIIQRLEIIPQSPQRNHEGNNGDSLGVYLCKPDLLQNFFRLSETTKHPIHLVS